MPRTKSVFTDFFRKRREARTLEKYALPDALWNETLNTLPFLSDWPIQKITRLRECTTLFLAQKSLVSGDESLTLTPLMRTLIAAQACTLITHRTLADYDGFVTIVVHPDTFPRSVDYVDEAGVVHEDVEYVAGEAWEDGPLLLSWPDVLESTDFEYSGMNLVIHEFAHKIDMRTGDADGVPPLKSLDDESRWRRTLALAYEDFCKRIDSGEDTEIDAYASEHESEFFAVCAELYVVGPHTLRGCYPEFFSEMNAFFKLWNEAPPRP